MRTENVSTLKIHKLTQDQYNRELEAGNIDETAIYLTPDEEKPREYLLDELEPVMEVINSKLITSDTVTVCLDDYGLDTGLIDLETYKIIMYDDEWTRIAVSHGDEIKFDLDKTYIDTNLGDVTAHKCDITYTKSNNTLVVKRRFGIAPTPPDSYKFQIYRVVLESGIVDCHPKANSDNLITSGAVAPAWYGYGGDAKTDEEFMAIIDRYIAKMSRDTIQHVSIHAGGRHSVTIHKHLVDYATIDDVTYEGSVYPSAGYCHRTRAWFAGEWNEWEWVDPPMCLNTEYRTTERWMGKPIYKRLLDFGSLPAAGTHDTEEVNIGSNFSIIDYKGIMTKSHGNTFASMEASNFIKATWISKNNTTATFGVVTTDDATEAPEFSLIVELKYVKL